jgi:hypothetical protein
MLLRETILPLRGAMAALAARSEAQLVSAETRTRSMAGCAHSQTNVHVVDKRHEIVHAPAAMADLVAFGMCSVGFRCHELSVLSFDIAVWTTRPQR